MSTTINTSSSLPRPYIGSCRNRNYISNKFSFPSSSLLLSNEYYFSTIRSSKSFLPNHSKQRIYLSNDVLQERVPIKNLSSPILLDEWQLNQKQKAKGFLSSSASVFLVPTIDNITPRTYYNHSPSSFIKEQQNRIHNYPIDLNKSSFTSSNFLNDRTIVNKGNSNQFHLLTPILPSIPSQNFTTNNNNIFDRSLTSGHPIDLQYQSDAYPINNMSSLRYSYDQRISDQGNKYIIQLKTDDYQENEFTITPRYYQNQLIIDAKHNEEDSFGGFIRRELHKIFLIPKHIDLHKFTYSYNKNTQELTIEMPYLPTISNENKSDSSLNSSIQNKSQPLTFSYADLNLNNGGTILPTTHSRSDHVNTSRLGISNNDSTITNRTMVDAPTSVGNTKPFDFDVFHRSAFRPQIIQNSTNENKLTMSLDLSDYQPEDIKISIKDQELIVKAERQIQTDTKKSRKSFFQSTSLPPQTDIEHLQSNYIDGKLLIEAPYLDRRIKTNEQTRSESQQEFINNDPYQQRTETVVEFVRRRRY